MLTTCRFKHASCDEAIGVDEFLAERFVLQHVDEDGDDFYLCIHAVAVQRLSRSNGISEVIQWVEIVHLFVEHIVERVTGS